MWAPRLRSLLLAGACLLGTARGAAAQAPNDSAPDFSACEAAAALAERQHTIPSGLLRAIGRVESGRRDPTTGRVVPWSWTINAEGRGHLFDDQAAAIAATRSLQQSGIASIDVGCFQVNLMYHPDAFASLEDGFDPARNADYAARFLETLRAKTGSWEAAVAAYHSATPERGIPYRDRVLAGWSRDGAGTGTAPAAGALPGSAPLSPSPASPAPFVVRMTTWTPPPAAPVGPGPGHGMRIWGPSAPGQGPSVIQITRR